MSSITVNTAAPGTLTTGQSARLAGRVLTGLGTAFLAFDSITHLIRESHVVAANAQMGGPTWFPVLCGAVMAAILVLYHLPRTAIFVAVVMWAGLWPRDARLRAILGSR